MRVSALPHDTLSLRMHSSEHQAVHAKTHSLQTLGWGMFAILIVAAVFISSGMPLGIVTILGGIAAILFAFTYPYAAFGLFVALIPFLGLFVHLPTGSFAIGERAFGGAIDVLVGEVVAMVLMISWGLKVLFLWVRRHDVNWKPWLPLLLPMSGILLAHLASVFSSFQPDPVLVLKYTLRPVFWSYLLYVALTVNFIRSARRLRMALGIAAGTGIFMAVLGFLSLGLTDQSGQLLPRARPLPIFGTHALGENHNLLAEWLSVTIPFTIALMYMARGRARRLLVVAAIFQTAIALLTFARTVWIVLLFEAVLLGWFVWREQLKRYASAALIGLLLLLPLGISMIAFSSTPLVQSSTSTRLMLSEIAFNTWMQSPWIGAGAGTFVERVGSAAVFVIEYGNPLDSHGWIQKLLAEVGLLGLAAVAWFVWETGIFVRKTLPRFRARSSEWNVFVILAIGAAGALVYQLFNTNYWTGKLWFPLGILLASSRALLSRQKRPEADPIHE